MVRIARPERGDPVQLFNSAMRYAKDYVSCRFFCPYAPAAPTSAIANTLLLHANELLCLPLTAASWPWPPRLHCRIQPSPWRKLSLNHAPFWLNRFHVIFQYLVHRIFIKDSQAPVRQQVHFQRLQLDTRFSWHIFDCQSAKVRQSRLGAYRRVLWVSRRNYVTGILVRPCIQLR